MASNVFNLDKGMEMLEQGVGVAKQQVKTTVQSTQGQVTGQTPQQNPPYPSQPLGSVKEQVLGVKKPEGIKLDTVQGQLTGQKTESQPFSTDLGSLTSLPNTPKSENDTFVQDLYGSSSEQKQPTQEDMAKKAQEDQDKQQAVKNQLQFVRTDIEDKMTELRHKRVEEKQEEEHVEEQQKMQDLQIEEKQKDEDIVLQRKKTNIENKAPGAG